MLPVLGALPLLARAMCFSVLVLVSSIYTLEYLPVDSRHLCVETMSFWGKVIVNKRVLKIYYGRTSSYIRVIYLPVRVPQEFTRGTV